MVSATYARSESFVHCGSGHVVKIELRVSTTGDKGFDDRRCVTCKFLLSMKSIIGREWENLWKELKLIMYIAQQ